MNTYGCASYLSGIHDPDRIVKTVDSVCDIIRDLHSRGVFSFRMKVDAIAFRGMSGAAIGYPLAYKMQLPILNVRKENDQTHSCARVEGLAPGSSHNRNIKHYVIVDDLIDTGNTINSIIDSLPGAKCVAIVLYDGGCAQYHKHNGRKIPIFHPDYLS